MGTVIYGGDIVNVATKPINLLASAGGAPAFLLSVLLLAGCCAPVLSSRNAVVSIRDSTNVLVVVRNEPVGGGSVLSGIDSNAWRVIAQVAAKAAVASLLDVNPVADVPAEYSAVATPAAARCRVLRVHDGDTITVDLAGARQSIRLWGVDAPELGQPFGETARGICSQLCSGRFVTVSEHGHSYQRLVAAVTLPDGTDLAAALALRGAAWWAPHYAPGADSLASAEASARAARRGLWASQRPEPPWQWRAERRAERESP